MKLKTKFRNEKALQHQIDFDCVSTIMLAGLLLVLVSLFAYGHIHVQSPRRASLHMHTVAVICLE